MGLGDEVKSPGPFHDYLNRQFLLQKEAYDLDIDELSGWERVEFIKWNILAAQTELSEVLGETCWKPWATYTEDQDFKDKDKYVEELVDVMHFIANLLLVAGVDDHDLSELFIEKQAVNRARQETVGGYAGDGAAWDKEHR